MKTNPPVMPSVRAQHDGRNVIYPTKPIAIYPKIEEPTYTLNDFLAMELDRHLLANPLRCRLSGIARARKAAR